MAGRGSLAGLLPFADANAIVLEMANEVLPVSSSESNLTPMLVNFIVDKY
jgi:predicted TIM-barrel enzyme